MEEKRLLDEALEELHGAKHYAKCTMKWRDSDPTKAKKYYDMALDELRHADTIYRMVEPRAGRTEMETSYMDEAREKYIEKCTKIKMMLEMYRGS